MGTRSWSARNSERDESEVGSGRAVAEREAAGEWDGRVWASGVVWRGESRWEMG